MEKSFWLDKWQAKEIGFHLSDFHPLLQKYHLKVFSSSKSVFVPLCGKSHDMAFLASEKYRVTGSELSEIAAQEFFEEQKLLFGNTDYLIENQRTHTSYRNDGCTIFTGDYFDLESTMLLGAENIYDRAALIALPKEMRVRYVKQLKELLPQANMLLITLDYDQSVVSGPPFSVDEQEVNQLFSFASIKQLYRQDIIEQEPRFMSKGLQSFNQTAYEIHW